MRQIQSVFGAIALLSATAVSANATNFTSIVDPANVNFTQALGINGSGTIVGYGNATVFNGFQLTLPSTFTRENFPGKPGGTQVVGIDGAGDTVGFYVDAQGNNHGFYKTAAGPFMTVDQPGSLFNQILGINQIGTLAVGYSSFTDAAGVTGQKAFSRSVATGTYTDINGLLPSNFNSQATGVNNSGTLVGFYQMASGNFSAFTDAAGSITSFQAPGGVSTQALGINDEGWIVGDYVNAGGFMFGFVDENGQFITLDPSGSSSTIANGINDSGAVVGFYTAASSGNTIGFETQVQVPEPASLLLLGGGLLGLGPFCRKKKTPGA